MTLLRRIYLIVLLLISLLSINCRTDEISDCKRNITSVKGIERCNCDPKVCDFYGDCCANVKKLTGQRKPDLMAQPSCISHPGLNSSYNLFVWDKCQSNYSNKEIKTNCEMDDLSLSRQTILHFIPVTDNYFGLIFKNIFCAICNNFDMKLVNFMKYKISNSLSCSSPLLTKNISQKEDLLNYLINGTYNCNLNFEVKMSSIRHCFPNLKQACPLQSSDDERQKCANSPTDYSVCFETGSEVVYRNKYCALCITKQCVKISPPGQAVKLPVTYSYSILFDFNLDEALSYFATTTTQPSESVIQHDGNKSSLIPDYNNKSIGFNDTKFDESKRLWNFEDSLKEWMPLITTICLGLSIASLCVLIIIHIFVRELRNNVNGFLVILLSISLLLALVCFVIASSFEKLSAACYWVGVLMYYLYLCSFAVMSLNGFDLLRTFMARSLYHYTLSKKKAAAYIICGFILPMFISAGSVTMDYLHETSPIAPKFGKPRCWINTTWGLIAWFYLPVAMSVIFNVITCVILLGYFCATYRRASQAIRSRKQLILICLKVSVLLGVTWSLTLTAKLINNAIILYISSIANSLQGFFVALCFLINKRTYRSVKSSLSTHTTSSSTNRSRNFRRQESGGHTSRLLSSASDKPRSSLA